MYIDYNSPVFMIFCAILVLIIGILLFASLKSSNFRIERTKYMKANAEDIFPYINHYRKWEDWAPWEDKSKDIKRIYSDPDSGIGATYEWISLSPKMHGKMEIIELDSPNKILMRIDFIKPKRGSNNIEFILAPYGEGTLVTQAMYGKSTFAAKLMNMFYSMDKSVGKQYEKGLNQLKKIVE